MRRVVTGLIVMTSLTTLAACSGTDIAVPKPDSIPIPTFVTAPDDLARSPQLQALVPRETAGLPVDGDAASADLLPEALAALSASEDKPTKLSRLSIYGGSVDFAYEQNGVTGRTVDASYRAGADLTLDDPTYDDSPTYPLSSVDATVPAALVAAIAVRVPDAKVTSIDLRVARSYGFGLVWNLEVQDARGPLATVFADLDGSVVAVDEES